MHLGVAEPVAGLRLVVAEREHVDVVAPRELRRERPEHRDVVVRSAETARDDQRDLHGLSRAPAMVLPYYGGSPLGARIAARRR